MLKTGLSGDDTSIILKGLVNLVHGTNGSHFFDTPVAKPTKINPQTNKQLSHRADLRQVFETQSM